MTSLSEINDEELVNLSVKDLNERLRIFPKEDAEKIKKRRRPAEESALCPNVPQSSCNGQGGAPDRKREIKTKSCHAAEADFDDGGRAGFLQGEIGRFGENFV